MFWTGAPSPWRSRINAVLAAFAIQAAEQERAVTDIAEAMGGGAEDPDEG